MSQSEILPTFTDVLTAARKLAPHDRARLVAQVVAELADTAAQQQSRETLIQDMLRRYAAGEISAGYACEHLGITHIQFGKMLEQHGIPLSYDEAEFAKDIAGLRHGGMLPSE